MDLFQLFWPFEVKHKQNNWANNTKTDNNKLKNCHQVFRLNIENIDILQMFAVGSVWQSVQ